MLKVLSFLFIGSLLLHVLLFLFRPVVERRRPIRMARLFLCFQGGVFLFVGVMVGVAVGPHADLVMPHVIWAIICLTMGLVELLAGLFGSDGAVLKLLYVASED
jgi:hypothetical protein